MPIEFYCDAVLLDMDGTLVDSTERVVGAWRMWAERHHLDLGKVLEVSHGRLTLDTIRLVAPDLATLEEVRRMEAAEEADQDGIRPVRGAGSFISALPSNRWAVVTSAPRSLAVARLSHAGLPVPAVLVSAEDVRTGKPHPDAYFLAARRLGMTPKRCLVFEDAPAGIESALSAGMTVVGVTTTFPRERLGGVACVGDFAGVSVIEAAWGRGALRVSLP